MRNGWIALALLLLLAGEAWAGDAWNVSIYTKDKNTLMGTTETPSFKLDTSLGTIEIKMENLLQIAFAEGQATASLQDGSILQGTPSIRSWKIKTKMGDFDIALDKINVIMLRGKVAPPPAPPEPAATPPPPSPPPSGPGTPSPKGTPPAPPPGPELGIKPLKTRSLKTSVGALLAPPDRSVLYMLDVNDSKVHVLSPDSLETTREITLKAGATSLSLSADGKALVALGKKTLMLFNPLTDGEVKSFEVENELLDLFTFDGDTIFATSSNSLLVISAKKQAVLRTINGPSGCLRPTPDGTRLYSSGGALVFPASGEKGADANPQWRAAQWRDSDSDFQITPDGKFAVTKSGDVLRLGRSANADMLPAGKIEPHTASIGLSKTNRLLVFTPAGFIKEYELPSLNLIKSTSFGLRVCLVLADEEKGVLYLFGSPVAGTNAGYSPGYSGYPGRVNPTGDLYTIPIPQ